MTSPYQDVPEEKWPKITSRLIKGHPLSLETIGKFSAIAWNGVWATEVGAGGAKIPLHEIAPPATVIGYFFEKLLAKELALAFPKQWRGGTGSEKDLHFIPDPSKSVEVKASGQSGLKIYGNRSYGQELANAGAGKKDKSGYYITVNFFGASITLIRFGWIDSSDWEPQKSPTGQMAGLKATVYEHKLTIVPGKYVLDAPVIILPSVGHKTAEVLLKQGVRTIGELIALKTQDKVDGRIVLAKDAARKFAIRCGAIKG